jgi:polysaccharide biosynthesis protein
MLWPIHTANLQAINALGRSDIYLKLEVIKKIIGIISLLISLPFGVIVMVYMKLVTGIISTFVNSYPNKKLLDYSYIHQIIDLLPALLLSIIMSIVVLGIDSFLSYNSFSLTIRLVIDIVTGLFVYLIMAVITKNKNLLYFVNVIKIFIGK